MRRPDRLAVETPRDLGPGVGQGQGRRQGGLGLGQLGGRAAAAERVDRPVVDDREEPRPDACRARRHSATRSARRPGTRPGRTSSADVRVTGDAIVRSRRPWLRTARTVDRAPRDRRSRGAPWFPDPSGRRRVRFRRAPSPRARSRCSSQPGRPRFIPRARRVDHGASVARRGTGLPVIDPRGWPSRNRGEDGRHPALVRQPIDPRPRSGP